jgi:hypothetical protein
MKNKYLIVLAIFAAFFSGSSLLYSEKSHGRGAEWVTESDDASDEQTTMTELDLKGKLTAIIKEKETHIIGYRIDDYSMRLTDDITAHKKNEHIKEKLTPFLNKHVHLRAQVLQRRFGNDSVLYILQVTHISEIQAH